MTTPPPGHDSGRNLDAEALSRVLDGRDLHPDAEDAERDAHSRAENDIAALRRALLLIGDTLAEPAAVPAAAAAAARVPDDDEDDAKGAVVLPFAARLRAKAPILAAAASLVAVIGLGAVLVNSGGSDNDSSATAQQAADAAAPAAAPEAGSESARNGNYAADTATSAQAPAAAKAAPAAESAGAPQAELSAKSATAASGKADQLTEAPPAAPQPKSPARKTSSSALDQAVTCSRAIFVGTVVLVVPSRDGYQLTVQISDPIANSRSGFQTYSVGKNYAQTPDGQQDLTVGREFLFVIPQSTTKAVYAIPKPNAEDRKQVDQARDRAKGADC